MNTCPLSPIMTYAARHAADTTSDGVLTSEQKRQVATSFEELTPQAENLAALFYDRLAQSTPGAQAMLAGDRRQHEYHLLLFVRLAVRSRNRQSVFAPAIRLLSRRSRALCLYQQDRRNVSRALLSALEQASGPRWTPETRSAWAALLSFLGENRIEASFAA